MSVPSGHEHNDFNHSIALCEIKANCSSQFDSCIITVDGPEQFLGALGKRTALTAVLFFRLVLCPSSELAFGDH